MASRPTRSHARSFKRQRSSKSADVEKTFTIVDSMSYTVDEVLHSSVCEACIRAGQIDLLRQRLVPQRGERGIQGRSAHALGRMIRAYGCVGDPGGARKLGARCGSSASGQLASRRMHGGRARHVRWAGGGLRSAVIYNLICEPLGDEQMRFLIYDVIYNPS